MLLNYLVLGTALLLSGVAAYYSIVGLAAIFSGAFLSIVLMGSALELGKLVSASWLYRNWSDAPLFLKSYLTVAVVVLMFITSMGIFGYLSRAHLETTALATSDTASQVETLNARIESKEKTSKLIETQLKNIDDALIKYIELGSVTRGLREKEKLDSQRTLLEEQRVNVDQELIELKTERNKLVAEQRKVEVEVGPLKYIAELIYGDEAKDHFDSAVRMVIILLISVFDPLAVILLIAANYSLQQRKHEKQLQKLEKDGILIDRNSIMQL